MRRLRRCRRNGLVNRGIASCMYDVNNILPYVCMCVSAYVLVEHGSGFAAIARDVAVYKFCAYILSRTPDNGMTAKEYFHTHSDELACSFQYIYIRLRIRWMFFWCECVCRVLAIWTQKKPLLGRSR